MPERILDRVPVEVQLSPDSQRLRHEFLVADPSLGSNLALLDEALGLVSYNNHVAGKYNSPDCLQVRAMNKDLAEADSAEARCPDGRNGGKLQSGNRTHTEPGAFIKRAPRHFHRTKHESGGKFIPRSAFLRGGIRMAARGFRDLVEFVEGHYMKKPPMNKEGKYESPYQPCSQALAMQTKGEIKDSDLIKGHLDKINEITVPAITDWYNDCRDEQGRDVLPMVCVPLMLDTETRGYVLGLDQRHAGAPLSVAELVKVNRNIIESHMGGLVGGYGSKADWLLDPERIVSLAETRYAITRSLMQDSALGLFKNDVLAYLADHYPDLTNQQRTGVLFKFANNAALVYLQGSAYGEAEHPYKWHNERCIVVSPEGNPPFIHFPDVQSFVVTPPEPERTITYANTMIDIWNHYRDESLLFKSPHSRMPDKILMFLTTPVVGELSRENDNYVSALNTSEELFHHMVNNDKMGGLYRAGNLNCYSLLYDYQTRAIRAVVNNRAITNR